MTARSTKSGRDSTSSKSAAQAPTPNQTPRGGEALLSLVLPVALATLIALLLQSFNDPMKRGLDVASPMQLTPPSVGIYVVPPGAHRDGSPDPVDQISHLAHIINQAPVKLFIGDFVLMDDVPVYAVEALWAAIANGCANGKRFVLPLDLDDQPSILNRLEPELEMLGRKACWSWARLDEERPTHIDTEHAQRPTLARAAAEVAVGPNAALAVSLSGQRARILPLTVFDVVTDVQDVDANLDALILTAPHHRANNEVADGVLVDGEPMFGAAIIASLFHTYTTGQPTVVVDLPSWIKTLLELLLALIVFSVVLFWRPVHVSFPMAWVVGVWLFSYYALGAYFNPLGVLVALGVESKLRCRVVAFLDAMSERKRVAALVASVAVMIAILLVDAAWVPANHAEAFLAPTAVPIGNQYEHWPSSGLSRLQHVELWDKLVIAKKVTSARRECERPSEEALDSWSQVVPRIAAPTP